MWWSQRPRSDRACREGTRHDDMPHRITADRVRNGGARHVKEDAGMTLERDVRRGIDDSGRRPPVPTGEHQGEPAVGNRVALACHRSDLVDDHLDLLLGIRADLPSADRVCLPPPRRRPKPGVRIVRYAVHRPRAQGRCECVPEGILGASYVARAGGEQGDEAAVALARHALGGTVRLVCRHQPFWLDAGSTTGRISIDPYLLEGHRLAQTIASSRFWTSTKK